jgi:hypothetical protein
MTGDYIEVKHKLYNSEGDFICLLQKKKGMAKTEIESTLTRVASFISDVLFGTQYDDRDLFVTAEFFSSEVYYDIYEEAIMLDKEQLVVFVGSTLKESQIKKLVDNINNILFKFKL